MKKRLSLSLMLAGALFLTSCSEKFAPTSDLFKVTPEVLVAKGGNVDATIDGSFPAKAFPTKGIVTITPVLKYDGGETLGTPITLQGSKVKANNKVIAKEGGTFSLKTTYKFIPAMSKSELFLRFTTTIGKKSLVVPDIKVADGVNATETLANAATAKPITSKDKFQRIIQDAQEASILFLIQQSTLRKSELTSEGVTNFIGKIASASTDSTKKITGIEVASYASPDGGMKLNEKLADDREKATVKFLEKNLKKDNTEAAIDAHFTPEDWDGFQQLVSASTIQDKDLILRVLSMYKDPEKREQEIKNLSAVYKTLADEILPQLRRSKLKVTLDLIGKSDEQLKDMAINKPSELTLEELLYAAFLFTKPAESNPVYTKTTQLFPDDYRAFNNLGVAAFNAGDINAAKGYFEKANSLKKSPEVSSNLALVALASNASAETVNAYLGSAAGSEGLKEAQGILYLKQGDYAKAVTAFGDLKTNNAALAQLLTNDYSKAKATLDAVANPTAETAYIKAVVGARTNNKDLVLSSLKAAINADKTLAKKAANDVEFSKYMMDDAIASLVK